MSITTYDVLAELRASALSEVVLVDVRRGREPDEFDELRPAAGLRIADDLVLKIGSTSRRRRPARL